MRIKILESVDVEGRRFPAGEALLPDKVAKALIKKGKAEAVKEAQAKTKR